ncbi:uncharacterized protein LOC119165556 isoform X1 [Rhipicephalus microplus]|uniref:uncharacterized protein LOC119165556 isoform X1 n=1 Tax=Rhipicephalus microplus TaxID=6941 RepID=UPI003F6D5BDC
MKLRIGSLQASRTVKESDMLRGALAAILFLISSDLMIHTAGLDIKQFVHRRERIWTYKTTRRDDVQCEVDKLLYSTTLSVTVKKCVFLRNRRSELQITGVFDTDHTERMTTLHRAIFTATETLLFLSRDRSCAVIRVDSLTNWDQSYYDMRLTGTFALLTPLPDCRVFFDRIISPQVAHRVFFPRCIRLMRQRNEE